MNAKNQVTVTSNRNHEAEPELIKERLPRLVYLAGVPRTGSTVLGRALGDIPGAIFVGELSQFWRRFANGELCSCGEPLPDCQFWSRVVSEAFGELKPEDARNLYSLEWNLRPSQVGSLLLPVRRRFSRSEAFSTVADARLQLLRSIAKVAQISWIVDSGKDSWLGMLFSRIYENNFDAIHIVRDPRGVAYSWAKTVKSDSEPGYMQRRYPAKSAFAWVAENLVIQLALQRLSATYIRIRYEDFAADPEAVTREVIESINMGAREVADKENNKSNECNFHWVAGNPGVRQASPSRSQIRLDEEWRHRLSYVQRLVVSVICGALMLWYGYAR